MKPELQKLVNDFLSGKGDTAAKAEEELLRLKDPECLEPILAHTLDWDSPLWLPAMKVVAAIGENEKTAAFLLGGLVSEDPMTREFAAWALRNAPQRKAFEALKHVAASDAVINARVWALHAIEAIALKYPEAAHEALEVLSAATADLDPSLRISAYDCIASLPLAECDAIIENAVNDSDRVIRTVNYPGWHEKRKSMRKK
jgi:hypothetical protein